MVVNDLFAVVEGNSFNGTVSANDTDPENDALTASIVSGPTYGTLTFNPDGTFTYTHDGSETTTDSFVYRQADPSGDFSDATVTINITPINDPPVAVNDLFAVTEGNSFNGDLSANDTDPENDVLTASIVSGPANGTLAFNSDGTFTYTHNGSETTTDSFVYRQTDPSGDFSDATVDIAITPVNDTPTTIDDNFTVLAGTTIAGDISLNDTDTDGDLLTYTLITGVSNGSLSLSSDGAFTYTHNGTATTQDAFSYVVTDPDGASSTGLVTLSVLPVNNSPVVQLINTVNQVPEDQVIATPFHVADILISDDSLGTNTLSLSGSDASLFEINNGALFLKPGVTLDHELIPALDVQVTVEDTTISPNVTSSDSLTIDVLDINEPPTISLTNTVTSLPENSDTSSPIIIADIVVSDDSLGTENITLSGNDAGLFSVVGNQLLLIDGTILDFESNPQLDIQLDIDDPSIGTTPEDSVAVTVDITNVPEQPVLVAIEQPSLNFIEGQLPIAVTDTLLALAPESNQLSAAMISISQGFNVGQDFLVVSDELQELAIELDLPLSLDNTTGNLTITGTASVADYTTIIRSVAFINTSENPAENNREITFTVFDGNLASNSVTRDLQVTAVNDEPEVQTQANVALSSGDDIVLDSSNLLSVDRDHAPSEIVYQVLQSVPGVSLIMNGAPVQQFTQDDINNQRVTLVHDGSSSVNSQLVLLIDDGIGADQTTTLELLIEPEIAAATPFINTIDSTELPFSNTTIETVIEASDLIVSTNEMSLVVSEAEMDGQTEVTMEAESENGSASTEASANNLNTDSDSTDNLLAELRLPELPFVILVNQQNSNIDDFMIQMFETSDLNSDQNDTRERIYASLLELNPIDIDFDAHKWIEWQVENGGFETSLDSIQKSFDRAADKLEEQGTTAEVVVGTSLGLTTGFLIWLLRGGTLLASLLSVTPLWKSLDPLPILSAGDKDDLPTTKDDSVEYLFTNTDKPEEETR